MTTKLGRTTLAAVVLVIIGGIGLNRADAAGASTDAAGVNTAPAASSGAKVYQKTLTNAHLALGPQSSPTSVLTTGSIPAGNYLITYSIGLALIASDNVVCGAGLTGAGNDGLFGGAGNGSSSNGVFGNAVMTDTVVVPSIGGTISVVCNRTSATAGTVVGSASITAIKVGTITRT